MHKTIKDDLNLLEEYSAKTVGELTLMKEEDFTYLLKRVEVLRNWVNGIHSLRKRFASCREEASQ